MSIPSTTDAIVVYNGNPSHHVQNIMSQIVATTSKMKYINDLIALMIWLFDDDQLQEALLFDWALAGMTTANEVDIRHETEELKKRTHLRRECKRLLDRVNQHEKNSPIILPKLSFNIFSHYLTTRKNRNGGLLSKSSYGGIRSAVVYLF